MIIMAAYPDIPGTGCHRRTAARFHKDRPRGVAAEGARAPSAGHASPGNPPARDPRRPSARRAP